MKIPDTPFRFSDLPAGAMTRAELRSAVAGGQVRRVLRAVYAAASLPDSPAFRARAAALVLRPGVVVSDRSAAWLHGIDAYDPVERDHPHLLEVASFRGDRVRRPEVLGARRALLPIDVVQVHGVPVTSPLRTASDLARLRGRSGAFAVLCMFARDHGVDRAALTGMADRMKRPPWRDPVS
jgi:hypothetical protein